jgi:hypothetical protein
MQNVEWGNSQLPNNQATKQVTKETNNQLWQLAVGSCLVV